MQTDIVRRPIMTTGRTINDVQPAPVMPVEAQAEVALPTMNVEQAPPQEQQAPQEYAQAEAVHEPAHEETYYEEHHVESHTPAGAIFLAVLVFLVLAGAAVYSQLQSSSL